MVGVRRRVSLFGGVLAALLMIATMLAPAGNAHAHVELVVSFDEAAGQLPEGVAVDRHNNVYVSVAPLGQVWKIPRGSTVPEVFGTVAGIGQGDLGVLGLEFDRRGTLFAGVQSANGDANGVWYFDGAGGAERVPGTEVIPLPNDVAFDRRGNLYVSDSISGAIWRMPRNGSLEPWLVGDPNLQGDGSLGLGIPIGANGIEYRARKLYVANTEKGLIVKVPIGPKGDPRPSSVLAEIPDIEPAPGFIVPGTPDGLALDRRGRVYVAVIGQSSILRVERSGDLTVIAAGDPLDWPSSLAFGHARRMFTLYAVNFSIGEQNGDMTPREGPGLVEISLAPSFRRR